jgi:uncharacterized protein (DUF1330 family)
MALSGGKAMKTPYTVALALSAGVAFGALAVQALHAQAKPPVYLIGQVEVTDQTGYLNEFVPQASARVQAGGGRFLARGGKVTPLVGNAPPPRVVIQQWESMEALMSWFNSDEAKKLREVQAKYAKVQIFTVEGLTPQ